MVVAVGVLSLQAQPLDAAAPTRSAGESSQAPWAHQAAQLRRAVYRPVPEARAVAEGAVVGRVPAPVATSPAIAVGGAGGMDVALHGTPRGPQTVRMRGEGRSPPATRRRKAFLQVDRARGAGQKGRGA